MVAGVNKKLQLWRAATKKNETRIPLGHGKMDLKLYYESIAIKNMEFSSSLFY